MSTFCKFVRKNGTGYEYGHVQIVEHATPHEKRIHVVLGKESHCEAALLANTMAIKGMPRIGLNPSEIPWRN